MNLCNGQLNGALISHAKFNKIADYGSRWHALVISCSRERSVAPTTPQIKNLIGRARKNIHAARAARTLVEFFDVVRQTTT